MHILIIPSEHFVTRKNPLASIFQFEQAKALVEAEFQVGVISIGTLPFRDILKSYPYNHNASESGVNILRKYLRLPLPGRFIPFSLLSNFQLFFFKRLFKKYIEHHGVPDVVHAHNFLYASVFASWVKRAYEVPFIITEHSSAYARGQINTNELDYIKKIAKSADKLTCVSGEFAKLLKNKTSRKFEVLHNIVDELFFSSEISKNKKGEFVFLNVANLDDNKNQSDLIKVFAKNFKGKDVVLKIAGNGPMFVELKSLATNLDVENQIDFLGRLSRQQVYQEMLNANCFVLPSKYETFGVVLIEALAAGLPLIATKCGGPEDIVNINNGLLIEKNNMNELSKAMLYMYENSCLFSSDLLRREANEKFGKDAFVINVIKLYKKALM